MQASLKLLGVLRGANISDLNAILETIENDGSDKARILRWEIIEAKKEIVNRLKNEIF